MIAFAWDCSTLGAITPPPGPGAWYLDQQLDGAAPGPGADADETAAAADLVVRDALVSKAVNRVGRSATRRR